MSVGIHQPTSFITCWLWHLIIYQWSDINTITANYFFFSYIKVRFGLTRSELWWNSSAEMCKEIIYYDKLINELTSLNWNDPLKKLNQFDFITLFSVNSWVHFAQYLIKFEIVNNMSHRMLQAVSKLEFKTMPSWRKFALMFNKSVRREWAFFFSK